MIIIDKYRFFEENELKNYKKEETIRNHETPHVTFETGPLKDSTTVDSWYSNIIAEMRKKNSELEGRNATLSLENWQLRTRIAELETALQIARLGLAIPSAEILKNDFDPTRNFKELKRPFYNFLDKKFKD